MGVYDIYEGVQLKVGDVTMREYTIGETVTLADGVYVGYEGVIVIKDSIFIAEYRYITDKWGCKITGDEFLNGKGPVSRAIKDMERDKK